MTDVAGRKRCAVYTRKSSEEGLEQRFNSLDAQREACCAYVQSQLHEGWDLIPELYDDGGYSGGTMDRPGLQQLLVDVREGKVDIIVVYKVDRLSRSLSDFAKMVEIMDAAKVSFVSVTQAFNTTTSMGRLTLNMLLSFAQFEREVTGERIRDKIAASKRRGLWMGGPVPLGYDVVDRKLLVNKGEAATVNRIMQRYVALGSVRELKRELDEASIVTKQTALKTGAIRGGIGFGLGGLRTLLKNRIYVGEIKHKTNHYAGEHQAIVDRKLFESVQTVMANATVERKLGTRTAEASLLSGLVQDALGRPMYASHAVKNGKRYRYYITHPRHVTSGGPKPWRVAAHPLERVVNKELAVILRSHGTISTAMPMADAEALTSVIANYSADAEQLARETTSTTRDIFMRRIASLTVDHRDLRLRLMIAEGQFIDHTIAYAKIRSGTDVRLQIIPDGSTPSQPRDEQLVALIMEAHAARQAMLSMPSRSIEQVAQQQGIGFARFKQLVRLSYLAPDIVESIFSGTQPAQVTVAKLKSAKAIPLHWAEQRKLFGIG
jgi:DNA invertase Pin-like site-specific DNA recombinase